MEIAPILTAASALAAMALQAFLSHIFENRKRDREESRVRERARYEWMANEHRRLVYEAVDAGYKAVTTSPGEDQFQMFEVFRNAHRRAGVLASTSFLDAGEAVISAMGEYFVCRLNSDPVERELRSLEASKKLFEGPWPEYLAAARTELWSPPGSPTSNEESAPM